MMIDPELLPIALAVSGVLMCMAAIFAGRAIHAARLHAKEEQARIEEESAAEDARVPKGRAGLFSTALRPKTVDELGDLRRQLARAGMRTPEAVDRFSAMRITWLLGAVAFFVLMLLVFGFGGGMLMLGSLLAALGLYGPNLWLHLKTQTRQEKLARSLPPTLDLLVTCMEAGLNLEQAMDRVSREIGYSDPEMAEELAVVVGELRAGLSIGATFRKLADRITTDEMRNLTNIIIQSASMGASLGRTLREYAASARRRRELGLEESAGKVTAGLTLPLCLCLLPATMLAMLGPAIVLIARSLFGDP
jgi:tight adherence protein C